MMLQTLASDPMQRRFLLTAVSAALIAAAWGVGYALELYSLRQLLLFSAALVAGSEIALRALMALRHHQVSIELLVTVAATGALVIGEVWEAAAVTFLFIFGAYLEARALYRTRQALGDLLEVAPTVAVVLRGGRQLEVAPHEVETGETVLVKPGAKLPVDGEVIGGDSSVDESAITGEPMPAGKTTGDSVYAGTVNGNGLLRVRATGVGADTTLARIIRRVEEAQEDKAPTQRFIERFARWYTPLIIALGALAWLVTGDVRLALTLLVIGCPGALVISTPVSIVAGIGRAAKRGILIKGGEHLERAGKITTLALDKTGTLTEGKPQLTDVIALQPAPVLAGAKVAAAKPGDLSLQQQEVLTLAAIAEQGSEHPLARPILQAAVPLNVPHHVPQPDSFTSTRGRGVQASYRGHEIAVGSEAFMQVLEVPLSEAAEQQLSALKTLGRTPVVVARDGNAIGILGIADTPREDALEVVQKLRRKLARVVMLTGDHPATAASVAAEVGIEEVHAGLLPEDKLELVRRLQAQGEVVAMVGDGINDAPALAQADIGIAMGAAGTDVAIETADMALMADDLKKLPEAIRLSRATLGNIRQNVEIALLTVAGLLAGVLLGEVRMAGGMLVHQASVLLVIANGMRLLRA